MKKKYAKYYQEIIDSVKYKNNVFTNLYSGEKVIISAMIDDSPEMQRFFNFATIYNAILDVDKKIKFSFKEAIRLADNINFDKWRPLDSPSKREYYAIYHLENAIFRTEILWDLLAQLFNLKENLNKEFNKVYATKLFHDSQQGKKANKFAKKVYSYMKQQDNTNVEPWEGNYTYVKDFRDKMTHRSSPNITSFSDFSLELRYPVAVILKRVVEDYKQVYIFIQEILEDILENYKMLSNIEPYNEKKSRLSNN